MIESIILSSASINYTKTFLRRFKKKGKKIREKVVFPCFVGEKNESKRMVEESDCK